MTITIKRRYLFNFKGKASCDTEYESDAHLIAAAPEMLAALKRVNEKLLSQFPDNKTLTKTRVISAIAKAEGKSHE